MMDTAEFEVWSEHGMEAGTSGPREQALREAMNYAAQYAQDGAVIVYEVLRTKVVKVKKVRALL